MSRISEALQVISNTTLKTKETSKNPKGSSTIALKINSKLCTELWPSLSWLPSPSCSAPLGALCGSMFISYASHVSVVPPVENAFPTSEPNPESWLSFKNHRFCLIFGTPQSSTNASTCPWHVNITDQEPTASCDLWEQRSAFITQLRA